MLGLITCGESWISSYDPVAQKRFQYRVSEHKHSTSGRRATAQQHIKSIPTPSSLTNHIGPVWPRMVTASAAYRVEVEDLSRVQSGGAIWMNGRLYLDPPHQQPGKSGCTSSVSWGGITWTRSSCWPSTAPQGRACSPPAVATTENRAEGN